MIKFIKRLKLAVIIPISFLLVGCGSINIVTREKRTTKDPSVTVPADTGEENGFIFELRQGEDNPWLTDYTGEESVVTLPRSVTINGKRYSKYGMYAFKNQTIKKVSIPNSAIITEPVFSEWDKLEEAIILSGVKELGSCTFSKCEKLNSVTLPSSLVTIEWGAFMECTSLTSIEIPSSVETIDGNAFSDCINLKTVTFNEGLKNIYDDVFMGCNKLESVYLPDSLEYIGSRSFGYCYSIEDFVFGNSEHLQVCGSIFGREEDFETPLKVKFTILNNEVYLPSKNNPYYCLVKANYSGSTYTFNDNCRTSYSDAFGENSTIKTLVITPLIVNPTSSLSGQLHLTSMTSL